MGASGQIVLAVGRGGWGGIRQGLLCLSLAGFLGEDRTVVFLHHGGCGWLAY